MVAARRASLSSDNSYNLYTVGSSSIFFLIVGDVYAFGMGTSKQLGSGDEDDITTPQKMAGKQLAERYDNIIYHRQVL